VKARHIAAVALAAAICVLVGGSPFSGGASAAPRYAVLTAEVNEDYTIELRDPDGLLINEFHSIPPGTYTVEVDDNSTFHNFHLDGPALLTCSPEPDCATTEGGTGHETWTVELQPSAAKYICDPHPGIMEVDFMVTGGGPPPPPPPPPPSPPPPPPVPPGSLVATVGTNNGTDITLTVNGQPVTHLVAGVYEVTVRDLSAFHNFHLRGPGVDRSTSVETTGTQTWTVVLTDGIYTFVCDPHASTMNGTFAVGSATLPPPPPPPSAQARCKVPKVVGRRLPAARRAITRARCRLGRVRRARSTRARGLVVSQRPRASLRRARGTRVHLVISRGRG
jgi:plastocyanin